MNVIHFVELYWFKSQYVKGILRLFSSLTTSHMNNYHRAVE